MGVKLRTTSILFFIGLFTLQFWLWIIALLVWLNPLKPVPIATGTPEKFVDGWLYHIILGSLEDCSEVQDNETGQKQEDIL